MTDAFYCLRYLEILLADHGFDVEVSTDTDPMELRLAFQKRPAVFLFAWSILAENYYNTEDAGCQCAAGKALG